MLLFIARAFLFFLSASVATSLFSWKPAAHPAVVRQSAAMNTYVTATIYDSEVRSEVANMWIDSVFAEIRRVEEMATDYNDTSQVGRINAR
ncbi:MAG: hypothetical protein AAB393_00100, partial [Bacteroidota bacterium]